MKRVILDTSVYGELIKETSIVDVLVKIVPAQYVLYGTNIIRNELRDLSKEARLGMVRRHSDKPIKSFNKFGVFLSFLNIFSEIFPLFCISKSFLFHNSKYPGKYLKLSLNDCGSVIII